MRPTAYRRNARGLRGRQAFEGVRMQAGALFAAGHRADARRRKAAIVFWDESDA
jgi:hypothetical protein